MNKYLISFRGAEPRTRIVEAPDATSACGMCIEKIATWRQISDKEADILIHGCGVEFVGWPF